MRALAKVCAGYEPRAGYRFASGRFYEFGLSPLGMQHLADLALACIEPAVGVVRIGYINLFRTGPGDEVPEHIDHNRREMERYFPTQLQLVIEGGAGCTFTIGGHAIEHLTGDLWMIRGATDTPHFARNDSAGNRTILVMNVVR